MAKEKLIGALDIGSNSLILLVARCSPGKIEPVNEVYANCRLGEQVAQSGRLSEAAMNRTLQAIGEMKRIAEEENVDELIVTATSAVRDAANRSEFLVRCHEQLAVFPQVLSGREEAHLTFQGASFEVAGSETVLNVDVGGGSTEISYGTREVMAGAHSLNLGCVRLFDMFSLNNVFSIRGQAAAARYIRKEAQSLAADLAPWIERHQPLLIASGGTATTYAAILLRQDLFNRAQINATSSNLSELEEIIRKLLRMSLKERIKVPGMEKERAEILPAGLIIFSNIFKLLSLDRFRITGNGLRFGIIRNYMEHLQG